MEYRCPSCETQFEIDLAALSSDLIRVRCSSCGDLFMVERPSAEEKFPDASSKLSKAPSAEIDSLEALPIVNVEDITDERTEPFVPKKTFLWPRYLWIGFASLVLGVGGYLATSPQTPMDNEIPKFASLNSSGQEASTDPVEVEQKEEVEKEALPDTPVLEELSSSKETPLIAKEIQENKPIAENSKTVERASDAGKSQNLPQAVDAKKSGQKFEKWPEEELRKAQKAMENFVPSKLDSLRLSLVDQIETYPNDPNISTLLSQIYAYLGRRNDKSEWVQYAYQLSSQIQGKVSNEAFYRAQALAYWAARKPSDGEKARKMYVGSTNLDRFLDAEFAIENGKTSQGMASLTALHQDSPSFFPGLNALIEHLIEQKNYGSAERFAQNLWEVYPLEARSYEKYREALEYSQNWRTLISLLEVRVETNPEQVEEHLLLAQTYRKLKDFDAAKGMIERIIVSGSKRPKPFWANVFAERGRIAFDEGRYAESIPYFEKSLDNNPNQPAALQYLAGSFYREKRYGESASMYERALNLSPQQNELHLYYGMSLFLNQDLGAAKNALEKFLAEDQTNPAAYYYMGLISESQGNPEQAKLHLQKALEVDPTYANARIRLQKLAP